MHYKLCKPEMRRWLIRDSIVLIKPMVQFFTAGIFSTLKPLTIVPPRKMEFLIGLKI